MEQEREVVHTAQFQFQVVLEVLKAGRDAAEIARAHDLHPKVTVGLGETRIEGDQWATHDCPKDRDVCIYEFGEELPEIWTALRRICWLAGLLWIKGIPNTVSQEIEGKQSDRDGNCRE